MPFGISGPEVVVILVIALLLLGPKKLPEVGRSVGRGMREFKGALTGDSHDDDKELEEKPAAYRAGG
jgi:sec-independent protein translocase protein TatA